jgi:predicted nucleic acid-binding protein
MSSKIFVDTSGWASLFVKTEWYHHQASQHFLQFRQDKQTIITSNYVIAELVALFNSPLRLPRYQLFQYIDAIKTASYVELVYVNSEIDELAWALLKNRTDKNWSLVDATSFIIMQQLNIQIALTTDYHFEQAGFIRLLKN